MNKKDLLKILDGHTGYCDAQIFSQFYEPINELANGTIEARLSDEGRELRDKLRAEIAEEKRELKKLPWWQR